MTSMNARPAEASPTRPWPAERLNRGLWDVLTRSRVRASRFPESNMVTVPALSPGKSGGGHAPVGLKIVCRAAHELPDEELAARTARESIKQVFARGTHEADGSDVLDDKGRVLGSVHFEVADDDKMKLSDGAIEIEIITREQEH